MKYIGRLLSKIKNTYITITCTKVCPIITHEIIQIFNEYLRPHHRLILAITCKAFVSLNISDVSVDVIACIAAEAGPIELLLTMKYPVTDRAINEILTTDSVINLAIIAPIFSGELLHRAYLANAPKCAEYIMKRMMCWRCFLNNKTILGEDCSGHRTLRKSDMNLIKQLIIFGADINNVQLHIFNV